MFDKAMAAANQVLSWYARPSNPPLDALNKRCPQARRLYDIANVLAESGEPRRATDLLDRLLSIQRLRLSVGSGDQTAQTLFALGELYKGERKYADAEPLYREGLDIVRKYHGINNRSYKCLEDYADVLRKLGRNAQADDLLTIDADAQEQSGPRKTVEELKTRAAKLEAEARQHPDRAKQCREQSCDLYEAAYAELNKVVPNSREEVPILTSLQPLYEEEERFSRAARYGATRTGDLRQLRIPRSV